MAIYVGSYIYSYIASYIAIGGLKDLPERTANWKI